MAVEMLIEPKQVFSGTVTEQGEGFMIAMKLALQAFEDKKPLLVFSRGSASENAKHLNFTSLVSGNPLAAARGLSRATGRLVLAFAGDVATAQYLSSFRNIQENIVYICLNNAGSASSSSRHAVEKQLAKSVAAKFSKSEAFRNPGEPSVLRGYAATASVAFPQDYMKKLLRAKSEAGFVFLDVHCPSPKLWGFDPSNTIEVGRVAVNSNVWPLFEYSSAGQVASYKPEQLESVSMYVRMQSRFSESDAEKLKNIVAENTKLLAQQ